MASLDASALSLATDEAEKKDIEARATERQDAEDDAIKYAADKVEEGGDAGAANSKEENFLVWWEEPAEQDSENPMNWTNARKWGIVANLSFLTFLT